MVCIAGTVSGSPAPLHLVLQVQSTYHTTKPNHSQSHTHMHLVLCRHWSFCSQQESPTKQCPSPYPVNCSPWHHHYRLTAAHLQTNSAPPLPQHLAPSHQAKAAAQEGQQPNQQANPQALGLPVQLLARQHRPLLPMLQRLHLLPQLVRVRLLLPKPLLLPWQDTSAPSSMHPSRKWRQQPSHTTLQRCAAHVVSLLSTGRSRGCFIVSALHCKCPALSPADKSAWQDRQCCLSRPVPR